MFYVLQNESVSSRRRVPILLTDAATGTTAQTGVATTTIFPYVNINGNAFIGGTGSVGEAGFGQYYYEFQANEVGTLGLAGIHITAAGCRDYDAIAQIAAFDLYSASAGGGISAADVWNYGSGRTITGGIADTVTTLTNRSGFAITGGTVDTVTNAVSLATTSMSGIANTVWSTDVSSYTSPSAGFDLANASSGSGITAGDVWTYASRTLTSGAGISAYDVWAFNFSSSLPLNSYGEQIYLIKNAANAAESNTDNIGGQVWTYVVGPRTITGGIADTVTTLTNRSGFAITGGTITTVSDKTGYSLSGTQAFNLTGNITGNLSGSVGSVSGAVGSVTSPVTFDSAQYAAIASSVWNAATRTLTSGSGISAGDVWTYGSRTITGGIADTVTTVSGNVLGSVNSVVGNVGGNVVGNVNGTVQSIVQDVGLSVGTQESIAEYVWIEPVRTITGGIADTVNTVTGNVEGNLLGNVGGNVGGSVLNVVNDVSLSLSTYGGIASSVWNAGTRTLTSSGSGISAYDVWNFDPTSMTSPQAGAILTDIQTDTNTIITDISNVPNNVWASDVSGYSSPGEAGFELSQAAAGAGLTVGDVWSAPSRTITGGIADTVTTVTNRSGFAITGGTITTVSDKTGYSLSGTQAFNLTGDITGNLSGSVGSVSGSVGSVTADVNVSTASMSGIAGTVWNTDVSAFTSPSAGFDVHNGAAGAGISAYDVWNFVLSNSDTAEVNLVAASAGGGITAGEVADAVWNAQVATYATAGSNETLGTDTYGTKIARTVNINRPLSINTANGVVVASISNSAINATAIASNAFTEAKFATDALTSRVIAPDAITSAELAPSANTEIADAVWAYATRNITGGTITTNNDKTGYSLSGSQTFDLTGNINGNLSGSVGSVTTVSSGAISASSFLAGAVDAAAVANDAVTEIANGVWSVGTRTITGGTITTVSDKTGYSLSGTQSFNLTGNITGNLSGSVGSVSGAVGSVTGAVGSVTGAVGSVTGAVGSVTSPVSISTASMSGIAGTVWNTDITSFTNPSAGYSLAVAGSGGVSAADVWTYNGGRTITGGIADTVTNPVSVSTASMTGIAGTVWGYVSRTLTSGAGLTAGDVWTYNISGITTAGTAGDQLNDAAAGSATNIINGPYFVKSNVDSQDGTLDVITGMVQDIQLTVTNSNLNPFDTTALGLGVNFYDQAGTLVTSYATTELYGPAGLVQFTLDTAVTANEGRYNLILSAAGAGNTIKFGPLQTLVRPF